MTYGGFAAELTGDPRQADKYQWSGGDPYRQGQIGQIDWSGAGATTAQHKRAMIERYMQTGQVDPGAGGGVGGAQMPYQPGAPGAASVAGTLETAGRGLLDPGSDYSRRMMEELRGQIGGQTAAQKRLAALEASRAGYGGGESAELLASMGDIDVAGLEAAGEGIGDLLLKSPELALQFLTPAMQARLGISAQDLEAWMGQQQLGQEAERLGMESFYRGRELDLAESAQAASQAQASQNAMLQQLALMFGSM